MANAIFSHSFFHLFSMGFYCFLCFYSCFYQIFSLYQTYVLPAVIIKNTTRDQCYNTTAKSKQSCRKAIETRYAILLRRTCFKIVYTHHFKGKKTPALEPVKGVTLTRTCPEHSQLWSYLIADWLFFWWSLARFEGMQIKRDVNAWDGYILSPYQPYSNELLGLVNSFYIKQSFN